LVPDELRRQRRICHRLPSGKPHRWDFEKHGQEARIDVQGTLTLDHTGLLVEAAIEGLGIANVPERAGRAYLDDGRLVTAHDDWCPSIPGRCLYYRHVPAGLRAFIEVLKDTCL
jgi:DNA-binding transcriptional LysR family regulator